MLSSRIARCKLLNNRVLTMKKETNRHYRVGYCEDAEIKQSGHTYTYIRHVLSSERFLAIATGRSSARNIHIRRSILSVSNNNLSSVVAGLSQDPWQLISDAILTGDSHMGDSDGRCAYRHGQLTCSKNHLEEMTGPSCPWIHTIKDWHPCAQDAAHVTCNDRWHGDESSPAAGFLSFSGIGIKVSLLLVDKCW